MRNSLSSVGSHGCLGSVATVHHYVGQHCIVCGTDPAHDKHGCGGVTCQIESDDQHAPWSVAPCVTSLCYHINGLSPGPYARHDGVGNLYSHKHQSKVQDT